MIKYLIFFLLIHIADASCRYGFTCNDTKCVIDKNTLNNAWMHHKCDDEMVCFNELHKNYKICSQIKKTTENYRLIQSIKNKDDMCDDSSSDKKYVWKPKLDCTGGWKLTKTDRNGVYYNGTLVKLNDDHFKCTPSYGWSEVNDLIKKCKEEILKPLNFNTVFSYDFTNDHCVTSSKKRNLNSGQNVYICERLSTDVDVDAITNLRI